MFGGVFDIISFILFFALIFLFPKLMLYQIISVLEAKVKLYEKMTSSSCKIILKKIDRNTKLSNKQLKKRLKEMLDFFVVEPDSIENLGIAKKIRYIVNKHDKKLDYFVNDITTDTLSETEKKNISAGIMHTIGIQQITKIIRHFIEIMKETKNFQIGMILQMQLPFIDKQIKALYSSVPAFIKSIPVGDCIGPLYAAQLIDKSKVKKISEGTVVASKKIDGKDVYILKADGPAANLGNIEEAIKKLVKKDKIEKIITIDASGKLEGEKTGSVAEGVGFAMGTRGAERFFIENLLAEKNIPVDAIVVKMKQEEALMPMNKEILNSLPVIDKFVRNCLREIKKGKAIIVGVGVTIGVGNDSKSAKEAKTKIIKYNRKIKQQPKKKKSLFNFLN